VVIAEGDLRLAHIPDPETFYRVEKMKWGGKGKAKDKTTVHYNPRITMTGIPLAAYDYVVSHMPSAKWKQSAIIPHCSFTKGNAI